MALSVKPAQARMLSVIFLNSKDPKYWTYETLKAYFGVSKVTINKAYADSKRFGVAFTKVGHELRLKDWGVFNPIWIEDNLDDLVKIARNKVVTR